MGSGWPVPIKPLTRLDNLHFNSFAGFGSVCALKRKICPALKEKHEDSKGTKEEKDAPSSGAILGAFLPRPFSRQQKKGLSFFPVGRPRPEPSPNAFSLLERANPRPQKEGTLGKLNCLRKGGVEEAQKKEKGCTKRPFLL